MATAAAPVTIPALAAFAWLFTPFAGGALVACSHRLRTAVARHLRLCLTAGWLGLAGMVWGATALHSGAGELLYLVGGPLGGLSIWSHGSDDDRRGDDPPPEDDDDPPEWDWERFERDVRDYEAGRAALRP